MKKICFTTNEIWPGTAGGVGRLITETCLELSRNDVLPVILLENMSNQEIQLFRTFAGANMPNAKVYSVEELLDKNEEMIPLRAFHFTFYHRSYQLCKAIEKLILLERPDGIEFPDYLGLGYVFIKTRRLWRDPGYLLPVWVRLHGTAELVDKADDREQFSAEMLQMYAMERYCIEHADFIIAPSQAVAKWYFDEYKTSRPYFHQSPKFQKITGGNIHHGTKGDFDKTRILFYGKLQHVKGPDLLVKAGIAFLDNVESNAEFILIGQDKPLSRKYKSYGEELKHLIPDKYQNQFIFVDRIKPEQLQEYVLKCQAAVVPSRMETFCLAAHELNWLGIPLILSDIPAFEDFFTHGVDCLKFSGSPASLLKALEDFFTKEQTGLNLTWNSPTIDTSQIELYKNALSWERVPENIRMNPAPTVSVVIPYINKHDYISQTLASVFSQTYTAWEILIICEGSTIEESRIKPQDSHSNNPQVTILDKEKGSQGSARNYGIKHARGRYILPLDSDGVLHPRFLELAVCAMENNPDLAAVSCYANYFQDGSKPTSITGYAIPYDLNPVLITHENRAGVAASLFRKSIFNIITYDENLFSYEDWDLWWSLAEKRLKAEVLPKVLFHYRLRGESKVKTIDRQNHSYLMAGIGRKHQSLLADICTENYCYFVYSTPNYNEIINSWAFKSVRFLGKAFNKLKKLR